MESETDKIIAILQILKNEKKTPAIKILLSAKGLEGYNNELGDSGIFWDCCENVFSRQCVSKEKKQMLNTFNIIGKVDKSGISGFYCELKQKFLM